MRTKAKPWERVTYGRIPKPKAEPHKCYRFRVEDDGFFSRFFSQFQIPTYFATCLDCGTKEVRAGVLSNEAITITVEGEINE